MDEPQKLQPGDIVGIYEVTIKDWFGPLPRAVIRDGHVNAGIHVILTTPWKQT